MIRIEQQLHGYDNGHNLLAGSIQLQSSSDAAKMAMLSDWTEYVDPYDENAPYLSFYCLEETGYFVFAKTWYAKEKQRPGCVWTHSLLIRKADILEISDLRMLNGLFARPEGEDFSGFSRALTVDETQKFSEESALKAVDVRWIRLALDKLLKHARISLPATKSAISAEFILLLMNFMPAELLWGLSACTGLPASAGRAYYYLTFNAPEPMALPVQFDDDWLAFLSAHIAAQDVGLSEVLKVYAADIGTDICKFEGAVQLIRLLTEQLHESQKESYSKVIDLFRIYFPSQNEGLVIKESFMGMTVIEQFLGVEDAIMALIQPGVEECLSHNTIPIHELKQRVLEDASHKTLLVLLYRICDEKDINLWGLYILRECVRELTAVEAREIALSHAKAFIRLSKCNQDIFNLIGEWSDIGKDTFQILLSAFTENVPKDYKYWNYLVRKYLELCSPKDIGDLDFFHHNYPNTMQVLLNYIERARIPYTTDIIPYCKIHPQEVLEWLVGQKAISYYTGLLLFETFKWLPETVSTKAPSAWLPFQYLCSTQRVPLWFYAFLYNLSFFWPRDRLALGFMRTALAPLHSAARDDKMPYAIWNYIKANTEPVFLSWDHCKMIRKKVVKRLKDSGCSKSDIFNYTDDQELNRMLMDQWD